MKKPLIPFGWLPGHWGLRGKTREIARAEYELSGVELDKKLLEIQHNNDPKALSLSLIELERKFNICDEYTFEKKKIEIELSHDEKAKKLAWLDLDLKNKKIEQMSYDKQKADLLEEPWVSMPKIVWDPINKGRTYFELDYNDYFIKYLKDNGYDGEDDEIINRWLNDVCISITEEINDLEGEFITPSRRSDLSDS